MWVYQETGIPTVALYGSKLSLEQARMLKRCQDVILFLDNDWAGLAGLWKAFKVLGQSLRLWVAPYPPDSWDLDPNDLSGDDVRVSLEHVKRASRALLWNLAPKKS